MPSTRMVPRAVFELVTVAVSGGKVPSVGPVAATVVLVDPTAPEPVEGVAVAGVEPEPELEPQPAKVTSANAAATVSVQQRGRGRRDMAPNLEGRSTDEASGGTVVPTNVAVMGAPSGSDRLALVAPTAGAPPARRDVDLDEDPDLLRAADGRVPGRRGRATRRRLLDQTAEMLRASNYRDLKVVDIARGAGTSPATFYQYFPEVESAILVLAEEMAHEGAVLTAIVRDGQWRGRAAYPTAESLVDGFFDFWESHRSVMRVVDLATEEGDQRFRNLRTRLLNEVVVALAEVIGRNRGRGHPVDLDPMASAGVLVAMLATVAGHRYGFEFWGIRTGDTRRSMARIVHTTVTGQKPPTTA